MFILITYVQPATPAGSSTSIRCTTTREARHHPAPGPHAREGCFLQLSVPFLFPYHVRLEILAVRRSQHRFGDFPRQRSEMADLPFSPCEFCCEITRLIGRGGARGAPGRGSGGARQQRYVGVHPAQHLRGCGCVQKRPKNHAAVEKRVGQPPVCRSPPCSSLMHLRSWYQCGSESHVWE